MRIVHSLAVLLVASALVAPASAGDEGKGGTPEIPRKGEALKKFDWGALFPPGDEWKKHEQVFVWNNDAEPETLDPKMMTGSTEHNLALGLFEGLTTHHPSTLEPVPGVAEWWEISDDGRTYTFHLRKDAKWSNGDPVTAEDFRWSWLRALDQVTPAQYSYMLYPIQGAERFNTWHPAKDGKPATDEGPPPRESDVGVEVVDPLTLRVTLKAGCPYFLDLTSFETLMPVHRATVEAHPKDWTQPENIVSNGPFRLDAWKPRDRIEMVPNPHWWNARIVRLERMVIRAIDEQSTSLNEYLSGGVDWIRSVPARRVEEAQAHADYYVSPYLTTYFFRFNTLRKPFDDLRVRQAFNQAIDKRSICEKFLKAGQIPATGVVPPGLHGYPEVQGLAYDPKRARELLAEAGYPEGKGFPEDIELLYNTNESHKGVCEQLVGMWKTNLGVKVQLANREWKVYLDDVDHKRYQIARAGWIADYADPNTFLDLWLKDGGNNNTGWWNERYEALVKGAAAEQDPAKRLAMLFDAEKIAAEELPVLPLYHYVNQGMLRPRVKGWHENVRDLHPFQFVYVDGPPAKSAGK